MLTITAETEAIKPSKQWTAWAKQKKDWTGNTPCFEEFIAAVDRAHALTEIPHSAILAVLWQESGFVQYKAADRLYTGDGGRAKGIGQIHTSPWQKHFTNELGYNIDLANLTDNIEVCARLLLRGNWFLYCGVCRGDGSVEIEPHPDNPTLTQATCPTCKGKGKTTGPNRMLKAFTYYNTGQRGQVNKYGISVRGIMLEVEEF